MHERLDVLLGNAEFDRSPRGEAALGMRLVAVEHATALRTLMALRLPTSAASLMRLQFEALTRGMWLLYAAITWGACYATSRARIPSGSMDLSWPMLPEISSACIGVNSDM